MKIIKLLKFLIRRHFVEKAMGYHVAATFLTDYPKGTLGYEKKILYTETAKLYNSMADIFLEKGK